MEDARSNHSGSPQLRPTISHSSETTSSYIELIQLDVSRTFPQLGLFQQNGPYHGNKIKFLSYQLKI
jgi:hypothetical protein